MEKTIASPIADECRTPPDSQDTQSGDVGRQPIGMARVGERALDEVQEFLSYAAKVPLQPPPDEAAATPDPADPTGLLIPLLNAPGIFARIDADDYPLVQRYRWRLGTHGYACTGAGLHQLRMHRVVMMVWGESEVDHKDCDPLNNRKANLRRCSRAENMWNQRRSRRSGTGVKGVHRRGSRFLGVVTADGLVVKSSFDDLAEAGEWVVLVRTALHGEFARHEYVDKPVSHCVPNLGDTTQDLDDGVDFFAVQGERDRLDLAIREMLNNSGDKA